MNWVGGWKDSLGGWMDCGGVGRGEEYVHLFTHHVCIVLWYRLGGSYSVPPASLRQGIEEGGDRGGESLHDRINAR